MNLIDEILRTYKPQNEEDIFQACREAIQNIVLLGLFRRGFFDKAAFYGGTALRILYGIDRFSEDIDFSLLAPDIDFNLIPFIESLQKELSSMGLNADISAKKNYGQIKSAFLKTDTQVVLLSFEKTPNLNLNKPLKIKLEIDMDPPDGFEIESKIIYKPIPFSVTTMTKPSLFAGKLHAVLCRKWKERVKGRDWYDLIWYVGERIPLNLMHLKSRMLQTGHIKDTEEFNGQKVKELLLKRIDEVDFDKAKNDVLPFIRNHELLKLWDKTFFKQIADDIKF